MSAVKNCSADGLVWAFNRAVVAADLAKGDHLTRRGNMTPFLSHPNFPWERFSVNDIARRTPKMHIDSALSFMCLSGKASSDDMAGILDGEHGHVAVFSPSLSARRLVALAVKRPELAAWCAMHPNGGDVALPGNDPHARVVADFKAKFHVAELSGRGTVANAELKDGLHI